MMQLSYLTFLKNNGEWIRELLEIVAAQVGQLTQKVDRVDGEIQEIKKTVIHIVNDHGDKLKALFDGYVQNSEKLDRIEKEVSRHEEVILRKVK